MNKYAIMTAALLVAGMISPAFADCDVHKADEDKQAKCAEKCDDEYLARKMNYAANQGEVLANKKACDAACGCPQNTKEETEPRERGRLRRGAHSMRAHFFGQSAV